MCKTLKHLKCDLRTFLTRRDTDMVVSANKLCIGLFLKISYIWVQNGQKSHCRVMFTSCKIRTKYYAIDLRFQTE